MRPRSLVSSRSARLGHDHPMGAAPGEVAAGDTDIAGELWRTTFLDYSPVEPVDPLAQRLRAILGVESPLARAGKRLEIPAIAHQRG